MGKVQDTDKVAVITELRQRYKLAALLNMVAMPCSTYYYNLKKAKEPDKYMVKTLSLKCMVRIKKYRSYKGEVGKIASNLIQRDFNPDAPNQKWTMDVTEFSLFGTKLYLSPILDMYNSEIISYNISEHLLLGQIMDMLDKAFAKIAECRQEVFRDGRL